MSRDRVVFYSRQDMASYDNLKKMESLLLDKSDRSATGINDHMERYHAKLYLGEEMYLDHWDEKIKTALTKSADASFDLIRKHFITFSPEVFTSDIAALDYNYRKSYWHLLQYFQAYEQIDRETFLGEILKHPHHIHYVLQNKKIVSHFNQDIRKFLLQYADSAEIILGMLEEKSRAKNIEIHLPQALTMADKEDIILRYLNGEDPNLNYIHLVQNARESSQLKLSSKTRLLANQKNDQIRKKIFTGNSGAGIGLTVHYVKDQQDPLLIKYENLQTNLYYGVRYLDGLSSPLQLFHCFRSLFVFVDEQHLVSLVSKDSEMQSLERISMASRNAYPDGFMFQHKMMQSQAQIISFQAYLRQRKTSIEELAAGYIQGYLNPTLGMKNLHVTFPDPGQDYLTKLRMLAPELENMLRQYQFFVTEGEINFDLLQVSSDPLNVSSVGSLVAPKYYYAQGTEITTLQTHFFSTHSLLHYIDPYKETYQCLFDLLSNEEVRFEQFERYQQDVLTDLLEKGYLLRDENDVLRINNPIEMYLIGLLYHNGALAYWRHVAQSRVIMSQMQAKGWIVSGNTLFTMQEADYINFYLNKKSFTNGFDIRNKYMHGTNNQSAREHESDYFSLLKLVVIALLKIEDDLLAAGSRDHLNPGNQFFDSI